MKMMLRLFEKNQEIINCMLLYVSSRKGENPVDAQGTFSDIDRTDES